MKTKKYTVNSVVVKVLSIKGDCGAGMKVGNEFVLDGLTVPPGFCGLAYSQFCPLIECLRFNAKWPWWDVEPDKIITAQCTDPVNSVLFELKKGKPTEIV